MVYIREDRMSNITTFPKWKNNSSPVEKLKEIVQYMETNPDDIKHVIAVFTDGQGIRQCQTDSEITVLMAVGMLEAAKHDALHDWTA